MGVENLSYVIYDDPAWFEEMVATIADCIIGTLTILLETGGQFDAYVSPYSSGQGYNLTSHLSLCRMSSATANSKIVKETR